MLFIKRFEGGIKFNYQGKTADDKVEDPSAVVIPHVTSKDTLILQWYEKNKDSVDHIIDQYIHASEQFFNESYIITFEIEKLRHDLIKWVYNASFH